MVEWGHEYKGRVDVANNNKKQQQQPTKKTKTKTTTIIHLGLTRPCPHEPANLRNHRNPEIAEVVERLFLQLGSLLDGKVGPSERRVRLEKVERLPSVNGHSGTADQDPPPCDKTNQEINTRSRNEQVGSSRNPTSSMVCKASRCGR